MSLDKFLPANGAERGTAAFALVTQFLARGVAPDALERLAADLGAPEPARLVADARRGYANAQRRGQDRRHLARVSRKVSSDLVDRCASHLGVRASHFDFAVHYGEGLLAIPTPLELVVGRFVEGSLALIVGESGLSKTFLSVSLALSLATGAAEWLGARISGDEGAARPSPRRVVYAIPEGFGYFKFRAIAWLQRARALGLIESDEIPPTFGVSRDPIRLLDDDRVAAFIDTFGADAPDVVVVDTWQRHGGPELDEHEMRKAIENVDRIRFALNATALIVHHTPKNGGLTPRGHGALDGSADTVALCRPADEARSVVEVTLQQRDLDESGFAFRRRTIQLDGWVHDQTGAPRSSCVVELTDPPKRRPRDETRADGRTAAIVAYVNLNPGNTVNDVAKAVGGRRQSVLVEINRMVAAGELEARESQQGAATTKQLFPVRPRFA